MRNRDGVKVRDASIPEIGGHNVLSEIQLGSAGPDRSAGVHQQRFSSRCNHQSGVSLTDVDCGEFHYGWARLRIWCNRSQRQSGYDEPYDPGDSEPEFAAS